MVLLYAYTVVILCQKTLLCDEERAQIEGLLIRKGKKISGVSFYAQWVFWKRMTDFAPLSCSKHQPQSISMEIERRKHNGVLDPEDEHIAAVELELDSMLFILETEQIDRAEWFAMILKLFSTYWRAFFARLDFAAIAKTTILAMCARIDDLLNHYEFHWIDDDDYPLVGAAVCLVHTIWAINKFFLGEFLLSSTRVFSFLGTHAAKQCNRLCDAGLNAPLPVTSLNKDYWMEIFITKCMLSPTKISRNTISVCEKFVAESCCEKHNLAHKGGIQTIAAEYLLKLKSFLDVSM